jgi:hypothetical protein
MKAFYDRDFGRVVFMGEKVYSLPIDRVMVHPELMNVPAVVDGGLITLKELVLGTVSVPQSNPAISRVVSLDTQVSQEKDFIAPAKDGCLILSKLQPPLKFDGKIDGKSASFIKKEYGDIPAQILSLISSGHLVRLSGQELSVMRQAHSEQLKLKKEAQKASRKSRGSIRRKDDVDTGTDDDILPSGIRNAAEIRL